MYSSPKVFLVPVVNIGKPHAMHIEKLARMRFLKALFDRYPALHIKVRIPMKINGTFTKIGPSANQYDFEPSFTKHVSIVVSPKPPKAIIGVISAIVTSITAIK